MLQFLEVEFILSYANHLYWLTNTISVKWKRYIGLETYLCYAKIINQERWDKHPPKTPVSLR